MGNVPCLGERRVEGREEEVCLGVRESILMRRRELGNVSAFASDGLRYLL